MHCVGGRRVALKVKTWSGGDFDVNSYVGTMSNE